MPCAEATKEFLRPFVDRFENDSPILHGDLDFPLPLWKPILLGKPHGLAAAIPK
jgi:hypothetical protein